VRAQSRTLEPKTVGANYEFGIELQPLTPFKSKLNVYSQMSALLDGRPPAAHTVAPAVILQGTAPPTVEHPMNPGPSIDASIADVIGTRTRFRSLEVSCTGSAASSHISATATRSTRRRSLRWRYTRGFSAGVQRPERGKLHADPTVIVRRSVLSAVSEQTKAS